MIYYALLKGAGEGCDYTIGCNLAVEVVEGKTLDQIRDQIAQLLIDYDSDRIDMVYYYPYSEVYSHTAKELLHQVKDERYQYLLLKQRFETLSEDEDEEFWDLKKNLKN